LHAAAVLAASGHGDVAAAKALIRKRAKDLGVDVNTLPGFGEKKSADDLLDFAAQLLTAYNELPADERAALPEGTRAAIEALRPEERSDQEPDASTPENPDADFALWVASREADQRSRELGYAGS
jgi:hypothetical protein